MAYNKEQQTFLISMYSNRVSGMEGTVEDLENQLRNFIEQEWVEIEPDIGTWSLAWGPAIFQASEEVGSQVADNTMFVARKDDAAGKPWYVISIAGTNGSFDWLVEDFAVGTQVAWEYGHPPAETKISLGTFIGLSILQNLRPSEGFAGAGLTVNEFLASLTHEEIELTVAGHSLGGALSPTLALWLSDIAEEWDPASNTTLGCLPSAGPTPGNLNFAGYYDNQLGSTTNRIWNRIDLVPHAWETNDLQQIPSLYEPDIQLPEDSVIRDLVDLAIQASEGRGYTQLVKASSQVLPGEVHNDIPVLPVLVRFVAQFAYQHSQAYLDMLGVELPNSMKEAFIQSFGGLDAEVLERIVEQKLKRRSVGEAQVVTVS